MALGTLPALDLRCASLSLFGGYRHYFAGGCYRDLKRRVQSSDQNQAVVPKRSIDGTTQINHRVISPQADLKGAVLNRDRLFLTKRGLPGVRVILALLLPYVTLQNLIQVAEGIGFV
jgi:hypothetical protein